MSDKRIVIWLRWLVKFCLALAWIIFIFILMTAPIVGPESDAKGFTVSDKLLHIFLFAVLAWLLADWLRQFKRFKIKVVIGLSGVLAAGWAFGCEYWQRFVPLRNSSVYDFGFAVVGIILALCFYAYLKRKK